MGKKLSTARQSLRLTGSFEAEVLVSLLLAQWKHPLASDADFSLGLLDSAAEVLRSSIQGEKLFEEISPPNVNLIAALWLAEATTLAADSSIPLEERHLRQLWLEALRRSIPSCFCNPDLLL